jgi:hypothetical protein
MIRRSLVVVVALGLLAGCGGGGKKAASTTTSTTIATTTTAPPPVSPLTGLPITDLGTLKRPALVVKIDNADGAGTNNARPQIGLNQADVVYEEMVEGSVTRLAAIFQSGDSDPVGPIRSARTTDIAVFSPLHNPLFAWSGANTAFAAIIRDSALIDVGYDAHSDVYQRRDVFHVAPHDLYSSTPELFSLAPPEAVPPDPLFQYRSATETTPASAQPVASIHIEFGGGAGSAPVDWYWSGLKGGFDRNQKGTPHVDENDVQIAPQNVIVELVDYVDTGFVDISGAPVPEAQLVGTGECWVLTNGVLMKGTWTKNAIEGITTYTDATGAPIKLTPGRTWVELSPNGGASITG